MEVLETRRQGLLPVATVASLTCPRVSGQDMDLGGWGEAHSLPSEPAPAPSVLAV